MFYHFSFRVIIVSQLPFLSLSTLCFALFILLMCFSCLQKYVMCRVLCHSIKIFQQRVCGLQRLQWIVHNSYPKANELATNEIQLNLGVNLYTNPVQILSAYGNSILFMLPVSNTMLWQYKLVLMTGIRTKIAQRNMGRVDIHQGNAHSFLVDGCVQCLLPQNLSANHIRLNLICARGNMTSRSFHFPLSNLLIMVIYAKT